MKPLIIYVSGPYSEDTEEQILFNVNQAIFYGIEIMRKGHNVIVPHLSHYMEKQAQEFAGGFSWDRWMAQDLALLEKCDAFFFVGPSKGACVELERAKELGLPIYYSLDEVEEVGE